MPVGKQLSGPKVRTAVVRATGQVVGKLRASVFHDTGDLRPSEKIIAFRPCRLRWFSARDRGVKSGVEHPPSAAACGGLAETWIVQASNRPRSGIAQEQRRSQRRPPRQQLLLTA